MFTIEEMLSKKNQLCAFEHFKSKKNSSGIDNMPLSELEDYWKLNEERIRQELLNGTYEPGIIKIQEIVNKHGKRRNISILNVIDRFITRLLAQKLHRYIEPFFLKNSYAYQENKSPQDAVLQAKSFIENGAFYVVEIDLKDFFDNIPITLLLKQLNFFITNNTVLNLIETYLYCQICFNGTITMKTKGVIQGNSISPILSNVYLHSFDKDMELQHYQWIRFADNIYIYTASQTEANQIFNTISEKLEQEYHLPINHSKSGVYDVFSRRLLGYDFIKTRKSIEIKKHIYQPISNYHTWHPNAIQHINHEYHLIQNGILNKKDYELLFENEDKKHHIPIECVDQLNIYNEATITTQVLSTFQKENIKVAFVDKYGNPIGFFIPEKFYKSSEAVLKQCWIYSDEKQRFTLAKQMQIASLHNIRSNLRYYEKRKPNLFSNSINNISSFIQQLNESSTIENLMLIEARARQQYYSTFNQILENSDFVFKKRTRRPPKDPLNAMISFGNTILYNLFLQFIYKTQLDPRIGIVHSSTKRSHTLNLDFADLFKPLIVDRTIFTLINTKQIHAKEHFESSENGGIYLNQAGKKIFLQAFHSKLNSKIVVKGTEYTYRKLMENEIWNYQKFVMRNEPYKPYKYY